MKVLIRLLGVFIVVAILTLPTSALIFAQGDEDWAVYVTVTTDPNVGSVPGVGSQFGFGAKEGASNGYDSGEGDEIAPPDPVSGITAYFCYPPNPPFQENLIMSVTGPAASIAWPLVVKMVGETGDANMTISWPDISSVPAKYTALELRATGGTTLANMKSVDHYTFSAAEGQIYSFQIRAEVEEIPEYDLTISSTEGGSVTRPGEGAFTYIQAAVVTLVAQADEGYRFVDWTGDVSTITNVNAASTTITMNGDHSITANFVAQHDLMTSSGIGGGVTTPGEGTFTYDSGKVVTLVSMAEEGYRFVNWTGDVDVIADVNAAATTITMDDDYEITANFDETPSLQYDLSINSTEGGSVTTPSEGTSTYDAGTLVDLMAEVQEGYRFVSWTGDIDTVADVDAAMTTITVYGDYSVTANFEEIRLPINWPLIGGIIGAVAALVLAIFFLQRRKAA